jgi:hypothetical protein
MRQLLESRAPELRHYIPSVDFFQPLVAPVLPPETSPAPTPPPSPRAIAARAGRLRLAGNADLWQTEAFRGTARQAG